MEIKWEFALSTKMLSDDKLTSWCSKCGGTTAVAARRGCSNKFVFVSKYSGSCSGTAPDGLHKNEIDPTEVRHTVMKRKVL